MKNLITTALLLLALLLPATATAYDFEVDSIYYNYCSDPGTVEVTAAPNSDYSGAVVIPATVTYNDSTYSVVAIGNWAFTNCSDLTIVTIPNSVITIGEYAFWHSEGLTSMIIPNSVTAIGNNAFEFCSGLKSMTIPNSVITIGEAAFGGCKAMTNVTIGNSVAAIGKGVFANCSGLTSLIVENENTTYDSRDSCNAIIETASNTLVAGCQNTVIPNSVTAIGNWAFSGCSGLTSVAIPDSVTAIGDCAFIGCSSLTSVTIPNSVTSIGENAFWQCEGLTSVDIPNSITTISNGLFSGCSSLPSVIIPNSVTAIGDYAFNGCTSLTSADIPNSVTTIGNYAFGNCDSLPNVTIPNSVTLIGSGAFANCSGLTSLVVESGNPTYDSRDSCNAIIETATNTLIVGCRNTIIPNTVTIIGYGAFAYCVGLMSVDIPTSVTTIGGYAFAGCENLVDVTVPNSVTSIGGSAFRECSRLTSVDIPDHVTHISDNLFAFCSSLANVTIPDSVTYIGSGAFANCVGLKSVKIPNSVTYISHNAFSECRGLTDVYCYIVDPSAITMGYGVFFLESSDYSNRTLHVLYGTARDYQADGNWYPYFWQIVEDLMYGDVNGDGEVNIADINTLIDIILGGEADDATLKRADVNGDKEISLADINTLIDIILGGNGESGHEWVDLGLPSGTLWATMNIGASKPEDYGDYFAWGEITSKEDYTWDTYKWCTPDEEGWFAELTKYNNSSYYGTVDDKSYLDPKDDAAFVIWGQSWRIPSKEQIQELCDNCTMEWTSVNDVNGMLLTGKNGNTMFLPAAGCRWGNSTDDEGTSGLYWLRAIYPGDPSLACGLGFYSGHLNWYWGNSRCLGYNIRAVRVARN